MKEEERENLRIYMLLARFYPIIGGTEWQALRLSQELRRKGHEVFVCTERCERELKKYEEIEDVPVYRLFSWGRGRFASITFFLTTFLFLLNRRRQFDILHVHLASSPAILGVIFGRIFHKHVIIKFGGAGVTGDIEVSRKSLIGRLKLSFLKRYGLHFVCPSQKIKEEMAAYSFDNSRISVIPNGVDTERFKPIEMGGRSDLRRKLNLKPEGTVVTYVGRFEPGKGVEFLLSTWENLVRTGKKNATLLLVGNGSLRESALTQIQKAGMFGQVVMTGGVSNVSEYLQASDIFVLPSLAEGLSNALLEAMSCGLAVIATRIGGTEEVIQDGVNGLLFEPNNSKQLQKTILNLLAGHHRMNNLGLNARHTIEDAYSLRKITEQYLRIYQGMENSL